MSRYVKTKDAEQILGLNRQTLIRYAKKNQIEHKKLPSGQYIFNVDSFIDGNITEIKENICYCRVSTHGQKDDLQRQVEYMSKKYSDFRGDS